MAKRRWSDLSERSRTLIVAAAALEGVLKAAALVDLARRPATAVRGSRPAWAVAIVAINAVGGAPLAYFAFGRQQSATV